jgi:putative ABC transport system substrate-binding protein
VTAGDPVGSGLAENLRRPGGNVTGLMGLTADLYIKRLDLLRQILPGMRRVGLLYNPDNASDVLTLKRFESECSRLNLTPIHAAVRKRDQITPAFDSLQRDGAQGLIVAASSLNNDFHAAIAADAARHRLPTMYGPSYYVEAGGLISYATNSQDLYRRAAAYVDKIFKGVKPGDLPIEQPTKFELYVNLKTAKALGLTIPQSILISADKVIE